jgi:predicted nucleic acid-binding protein
LGLSRIFFDTNLFIYLLEDFGELGKRVSDLMHRMSERRDQLLTSTLTLGEVLVKPLSVGQVSWANQYEILLDTPGVVLIPFDRECARVYAGLRQDRALKAPDAMQLSCAAVAKCDVFITNDDRLSRRIIPGIQFILPLEKAFI